jgi:hypothetical protein
MGTKLTRISEKAHKEPELVFTSLYHHSCDVDNLRACYDSLDARKAPGVDGVTKAKYGKNLEENLRNLSAQLKRMDCVERILFKWFNRKSQRRAYTWPSFRQALVYIGWPTGSIRKGLNPCRRAEAY